MKKPTVVLATIIGIGIAQVGMYQMGSAQPVQSSYSQALDISKQSLTAKNYIAAGTEAQKLLTLANSPEQTGKALLILGESFYRRKMYDQAREQWDKVLNLTTNEDDGLQLFAHLNLARSYAAENNFGKAIPEYKIVVGNFEPEDKSTAAVFSLALANAYYNTKQFDLAQQQLSPVIASSQDNPAFLLVSLTRSGQVDLVQRKFKKSLAKFKQVLDVEEVTPGIQAYAQRQISPLNSLIASHLEEGGINGNVKINVKSDITFDNKINVFIQTFIDDVIVDKVVIKSL